MTTRNTMFLHTLILQFLVILPMSFSSELREHDALCGPGDSCYAVFYQRRTFLESWRACRERGGNLATVKNAQEAALVEQLLTSSTGSRSEGDLQLRLWIGLQRQPRQCAPQKPLRGFTWTTGDQDTAFTNWVSQPVAAGPPSSCSAPRCVAIGLGYSKPEDDFKWLEGSCTLPVDGFVCKFRYQGMCSALTEGNVHYSVPFGYKGNWLDMLPFGTVAVVSCERQQQDMSVLCMLKEDGTIGWNKDEPLCQNPEDLQCESCQQLCEGGVCACQEGYVLQPDGRSCELEEDENFEAHGCPCQYQCVGDRTTGKRYQCICPEGYELAADEHSCEDVDECEDEETCEHSCQNTLGSYTCSCDLGFTISEDDPERCVDIDECRIARMCQQMCVNYLGGFECFCSEGYELDTDRVSCKPLDLKEPKYELNVPVTRLENSFESEDDMLDTTEGWYWTDLTESETPSSDERERLTAPFIEEEATISPAKEDIAVTITSLLGLGEPVEIDISATVIPVKGTPLVFTQDKDGRNTFQDPPLISILPTQSFSAEISRKKSIHDTWSKAKVTPSTPTIKLGTIKAVREMSTLSTLAPRTTSVPTLAPRRPVVPPLAPRNPVATRKSVVSTVPPSWPTISAFAPSTPKIIPNVQGTREPKMELDAINSVHSPEPPLPKHKSEAISPDLLSLSPNSSQESKGKRDNRWLVVALLVPLCVFLVIMLALGIVYCTRCGGDTKPRSVTDCYHWVTGGGPEKGLPPSGMETPSIRPGV